MLDVTPSGRWPSLCPHIKKQLREDRRVSAEPLKSRSSRTPPLPPSQAKLRAGDQEWPPGARVWLYTRTKYVGLDSLREKSQSPFAWDLQWWVQRHSASEGRRKRLLVLSAPGPVQPKLSLDPRAQSYAHPWHDLCTGRGKHVCPGPLLSPGTWCPAVFQSCWKQPQIWDLAL